nr:transposase [Marinomonas algicola]
MDGTLSHLMSHPWVVYCKSALEYRETLVSYLARYTYRVGLNNHRLESWKDNQVTLSYFDNKTKKASRLSLEPAELIRRFLLHVLPKGFMRIRHYGYLSNAVKKRSLANIKRQSGEPTKKVEKVETDTALTGCRCPSCGESKVVYLGDNHHDTQLRLNSS